MTKYYTYILLDSSTGEPFYVGKGVKSRMYQHKIDALNPNYSYRSVHRKIQSILKQGNKISYDYLLCEDECQAFSFEKSLIEFYGRKDLGTGCLCNLTDGGEGTSNQNPESVEKRAAKHRGMKRSQEARERMSKVQKQMADERRTRYGGKACSPELLKKMSETRKGIPWSENARNVKRNKPTARVVLVHKKDTGEFVGEWESISLCAKELNVDTAAVWKICTSWESRAPDGKMRPYKSHKGYTFKYKD